MSLLIYIDIILGLILILIVWKSIFFPSDDKCPYWKRCKIYKNDSYTCNEARGCYYGVCKLATCAASLRDGEQQWKK